MGGASGHAFKTLGLAATLAAAGVGAQPVPWYEAKQRTGAKLADIVHQYQLEEAARNASAEGQNNLTSFLLKDPETFEQDEDFQFYRWLAYVEPRVGPSGDLSLLAQGQQTIDSLVFLDAQAQAGTQGNWEPLGPFSRGTMGAGRLNWIEMHPQDTSTMMVGSPSGGLWFTHDGGKSWTTTTDKIAVLGAAWAVYHPTRPETIYLGTGDGDAGESQSIGVLRSTDGGKTWGRTGLDFPVSGKTQISKLVTDPRNPEKLFVATSTGVSVSLDGGNTFTAATGITGKVWDLEINPGNPNIVYASTNAFFRSTDGGKTFAAVTGTTATSSYRMMIGVSPNKPSWVYLLRGASNATEGVSLSTDDGQTFSQKGPGTEIGCNQTFYDYALAVNPNNANDLYAGCTLVYHSGDGGATWTKATSSIPWDIHDLAFRKDGALFVADDGGLNRATDSAVWLNLNNNLNIGQSYRIGVYRYDYDRVCTGRQDNGTTIRDGGDFQRALQSDGFECFWNNTGTRFYGEYYNGAFNICNYANGQISGCTGGPPSEPGPWETAWSHDLKEANRLYAGRDTNMWTSPDDGATWTRMGTLGGTGTIRNFAVAPSNNQVVYVLKGPDVYRTTNGGQAWTNIKGSITMTPVSVAVSSSNPNDLWVTVSGYTAGEKVWHSTNGGQTWLNETQTGLPNLPCNAVVLDSVAGGIYVGLDAGVYYKKIGQAAWQSFSDGLPNASVHELEIAQKGPNASDRRILAATFGRGVWRSTLWGETPSVSTPARAPLLSRLSAVRSGDILRVSFQTGDDRPVEGNSILKLHAANGALIHQEVVPNTGAFERDIPLAGKAQGIFWFTLEGPGGRVSRRIALY
jgi:photosystem II stability/assembly factor-like uncharacterized protein